MYCRIALLLLSSCGEPESFTTKHGIKVYLDDDVRVSKLKVEQATDILINVLNEYGITPTKSEWRNIFRTPHSFVTDPPCYKDKANDFCAFGLWWHGYQIEVWLRNEDHPKDNYTIFAPTKIGESAWFWEFLRNVGFVVERDHTLVEDGPWREAEIVMRERMRAIDTK